MAAQHDVESIRKQIGANSLAYVSHEGMIRAIGKPRSNLCLGCMMFGGKTGAEVEGHDWERILTTLGWLHLDQALDALEKDHEFLLRGDVFTEDLVQTWIEWKRTKELDPIRLRPHPHEFYLYYDN